LRTLRFSIFTEISKTQVTQNGTRNKGRDTQDGAKNVPRSLPVTDAGAATTVQGVSTAATGRKNDTRSTGSNQTDIPAGETELGKVTKREVKSIGLIGAHGASYDSEISKTQVTQNDKRNKGRDTGVGQKTMLGDLPEANGAATATVSELSPRATGSQDANGSARSGQASVLAAESCVG